MSQVEYIPGTCNIGGSELKSRRVVAVIGLVLTLITLFAIIAADVPRSARLGIFLPLMVMSVGWVQSRKRFCLAYGFAGTFNFGKLGNVSRVADPVARAADRKTALLIIGECLLYAVLLTALVVVLPL